MFHNTLKFYEMQVSVFITKVVLEHGHTHLCMCYISASVLSWQHQVVATETICGTLITATPAQ